MWEQDWALLGIEPTTELGAIKKAYALRLKTTRPDDDAVAYQALRSAYERAQQWVKWQQDERDIEPPSAETAATSLHDDAPASPQSPEDSPPAAERALQPVNLIETLERQWRKGEAALMAEWTAAQREIDHQPLIRQTEFSAAFAQWVLALPSLPDTFIKAVDAHFGWLTDFRTERRLGASLAHALHEALDSRLRPPKVAPEVLALAEPLQAMTALRASGASWWRLQWLFFLLQPLLARRQGMLGSQWLERLGLARDARTWLAKGVTQGMWVRVALVSALFAGAGWVWHGSLERAGGAVWVWLLFSAVLMRAAQTLGILLTRGPDGPLGRWRRRPLQPWLAIVWLLFAALLAYLDTHPTHGPPTASLSLLPDWALNLAWVGFAIAGLALAWPLEPQHGCIVAGLAPLVGYFFVALLGDWLLPPAALLVGLAWMLFATAVQEQRLTAPEPVRWLLRPMLNSLVLADRWTYALAMLPAALCLAVGVIGDKDVPPSRLFVTWVLGILLVAWLQTKADAWGLHWLAANGEQDAA